MSGAVTLCSDELLVECQPDHGFHITRLLERRSGVNLLWRRQEGAITPCPTDLGPAGDESHRTFDVDLLEGGWFAMFPTAGKPGVLDGALTWMHGEVARLPWEVLRATASSITCQVRTPSSGFDVRRTVSVDGGTVAVQTVAINSSGNNRSCTFGEHPCLSADAFAGGEVIVDVAAGHVVEPQPRSAAPALDPAGGLAWPVAHDIGGVVVDVSRIPAVPDGRHDHVALHPTVPQVVVTAPLLGGRLVQRGDSQLPFALLWRHFGAEGSYLGPARVLSVEQVSAPGIGVQDAIEGYAVTVVPPGCGVGYSFQVSWQQEGSPT
ncbi:aldose epimerase family protein [Actinotalea fermentans]|uniref:Aldose 1-epimerase n=1 Tax=Actinotalea fermentans TaxID=43671 RepID=A0A511YZU0_9CELL|nr:hypothetical protein [Actinotalea fermentans]KGM17077.1 hypothetical protein N867_10290 [Actinotalea fermentans ATCC 43279 = JCM 9966 = DSM 3133]GEN80636.1 hypothetical protein AFE02nite_23700 [Actinotalea fermentans]